VPFTIISVFAVVIHHYSSRAKKEWVLFYSPWIVLSSPSGCAESAAQVMRAARLAPAGTLSVIGTRKLLI